MYEISRVTCEHMENPVSIDIKKPRFSWEVSSEQNDVYQSAYQIIVKKETGELVWDSGKTECDHTIEVYYQGEMLVSAQKYFYQIISWNQSGEKAESQTQFFQTAFFETADWEAAWIEPDPLPQLPENPLKRANQRWMDILSGMMQGKNPVLISDEENLRSCGLEPYDPPVRMRRTFEIKGQIRFACLYLTAHGIYEVKINGRPVTESLFNPGFTTYDKRIRYQVYPVEHLLITGENAIAVTIADGWYKGKIALGRGCEYGEVPGLLLQMEVTYTDGKKERICSDGEWRYSYDGPIRMADLFLGQTVDARLKDGEPSLCDYHAENWKPVIIKEKPGEVRETKAGEVRETKAGGSRKDEATLDDAISFTGELEAQKMPPVRVYEKISAKRVWQAPNGETLVDFGQNMAGMIQVVLCGERGEKITFEHGEVLDAEGNFIYVFEGDETRAQRDCYICAGTGEEIFCPQFTYHGFRYVRVTGGKNWKKEQFTALAVGTDHRITGKFWCSDEMLEQLQHNILWSQRSNNITIPTDCPTREKAGWTGDVVVYGQTALYNQEMTAFYEDWLKSIRMEQTESGHVRNTVPLIKNYVQQTMAGSLGWGDVILTLPMQLYRLRGDMQVLKDNYAAMEKWMEAMKKSAYELPVGNPFGGITQEQYEAMSERQKENQHYLINTGFHFGDWLVPSVKDENGFSDGPKSSFLTMNYVDTALLTSDADLFAEVSGLLGEKEKAQKYRSYAARVREAFYEEYVDENGRLGQEMQGNYILALKYHMVPQEKEALLAAHLHELIQKNDYCLDTGFMSVLYLLDILCDYGYQETAYRVLWQRKCPSWLYEIEHGATTMWENWDAIREDGSVCGCSFNHYAFGCVGDFMYRRLLGIQNAGTGYDRIRIAPDFGCGLLWAEGSYHGPHGMIGLRWEKTGDAYRISGTIPANSSAFLELPDKTSKELGNGRFEVTVSA